MRVLVTAASRHGATAEIARVIGEAIAAHRIDVEVAPPESVDNVDRFDAVVLGSAVYAGRWLEPARRLATRHHAALQRRPVWLFSSGPIGEPPMPAEDASDIAVVDELVSARGCRRFGGRIDRSSLGMLERTLVSVMQAPDRDDRPWHEIRAWADEIAASLLAMDATTPTS